MHIRTFRDYNAMSRAVAALMTDTLEAKPDAVIVVATGETPKGPYEEFVKRVRERNTDVSRAHFAGLDEWLGITPDTPGSCAHFLYERIFIPLQIPERNIHLFNGLTADPGAECQKMNEALKRLGGIDLMIVGIGTNGHIGLNEPGTAPDVYAHVSTLHPSTITGSRRYFEKPAPLTNGITLGLQHLMESRLPLLIANGENKASIINVALRGPETTDVPATILRHHGNAHIYLDDAAARELDT
jgi:glucosamine-6-phosphate isomerase